jgi:hypothetical protein
MMQTLGSLIDQLGVVNLKMWNAQEFLYKIKDMTLEEFKERYSQEENLEELYTIFQKSCDLNLQRNNIIDEIDELFADAIKSLHFTGSYHNHDKLVQRKHKTYDSDL